MQGKNLFIVTLGLALSWDTVYALYPVQKATKL